MTVSGTGSCNGKNCTADGGVGGTRKGFPKIRDLKGAELLFKSVWKLHIEIPRGCEFLLEFVFSVGVGKVGKA